MLKNAYNQTWPPHDLGQKLIPNSGQQQTTILQNMQKLMESLVSNTSNPHNNWDAAIQQVGEIRKQGQEWADSIEKNRKHFDHKIDQISKWVLGAILGFGIAIVCLLVFIVINLRVSFFEDV